jgi:hypothetical protein
MNLGDGPAYCYHGHGNYHGHVIYHGHDIPFEPRRQSCFLFIELLPTAAVQALLTLSQFSSISV